MSSAESQNEGEAFSTDLMKVECREDVAVVTPTGNLGEFVISRVEEQAEAALKRFESSDTCRHIIIDFCNTDYFGSSALGFFVRLWKRVRQRGGRMALCNLSEHEIEVLKITRLNEFWTITDTLDDALTAVRN